MKIYESRRNKNHIEGKERWKYEQQEKEDGEREDRKKRSTKLELGAIRKNITKQNVERKRGKVERQSEDGYRKE